jgi:hypothetical protein
MLGVEIAVVRRRARARLIDVVKVGSANRSHIREEAACAKGQGGRAASGGSWSMACENGFRRGYRCT